MKLVPALAVQGLVQGLVMGASCLAQTGATFVPLGDLTGGTFVSRAFGISGDGTTVVGLATAAGGAQAFRWTAAGGLVGLPLLAGTSAGRANGVSGDGSVVVGSCSGRSVRWVGGVPQDLNTFGDGSISAANGVSRNGIVVVGNAFNGDFSLPDTWPYSWTSAGGSVHVGFGSVTPQSFEGYGSMAASVDGSVIVGNEGIVIYDAFRWTSAGLVGLGFLPFGPQTPASSATACSGDGSVLAGWSVSIPGRQAFRWSDGTMVGIGDLAGGAFSSEANGISGDGAVIVGRGTSENGDEAFMWSAVGGMRSIPTVLNSLGATGLSGWSLRSATAISADGRTIVGWGTNPTGDTEAWLARIPGTVNCYVNCDGSLASPAINALDFACFLARFGDGESYANCDGSTTIPVLNVLDFMCFLNRTIAGCS